MDKILPVYKLVGYSSYDLIRDFKRQNNFKGKIGHAGTLDPFACGLVLLLLGDATKKFDEIKKWDKTYLAGLRLGATSTTGDPAGEITPFMEGAKLLPRISGRSSTPSITQIKDILKSFIGEIEQEVPAYSAAKHKGQPLYKLARKGIKVAPKTKQIEIKNIELVIYKYPLLTIRVNSSGGTYIRQLAMDIGKKLGIGAYLYYLEREAVGKFTKKDIE